MQGVDFRIDRDQIESLDQLHRIAADQHVDGFALALFRGPGDALEVAPHHLLLQEMHLTLVAGLFGFSCLCHRFSFHRRPSFGVASSVKLTLHSIEQHRLDKSLDLGARLIEDPHLFLKLEAEVRNTLFLQRPFIERVVEQRGLAEFGGEDQHRGGAGVPEFVDQMFGFGLARVVFHAGINAAD